VRPAVPVALALSARAYDWLLRAYPASFRSRFGGEMALVFSDCCRAEWQCSGPLGVSRLLGRTVLDTLASAPPLWAERLEEVAMDHRFSRGIGLWLADRALVAGGLALLAVGTAAWPPALSLGWAALGLAFFAWVAEADGLALPRPGRVAIRTCGCWETPLAFTVRRGDRVLLFAARRIPIEEAGRTRTRCATGRTRPRSSRASSCPSVPGASGRCEASSPWAPCASSTTSGSAMSRAGPSSARSPAPRCERDLSAGEAMRAR
jgi:hypothetical protein